MRVSSVRNTVLEMVCQLPQPFTAQQLVSACEPERISVATVYNVLDLLVDAQVLHATSRQRGKTNIEYELIVGSRNRMQVICLKCGRVTDVRDKAISRLVEDRKYANFNPQHFSLFVYGECKTCRVKKTGRLRR